MGEQDSKQREVISTMVDGQASDADLDRAIEMLACGSVGRQTWHAYHVVGDVMRGGVSNDVRHDAAFLLRLQGALQQEAVGEPAPPTARAAVSVMAPQAVRANRPSANEERFSWRWVASVAVVAVAVTAGWLTASDPQQGGSVPMLAQKPAAEMAPRADAASAAMAAQAVVGQPVMVRDPKLDQWLAAHQQFGGASALQVPVGFVRSATSERAAR